ncbi:MAG: gamma-glutamyl-gamma-aminobutyrate hydrolase family protein [Flavobacteriales bacterium]
MKSLKYLGFLFVLLITGCDSEEQIETTTVVEEKQPHILLISKDDNKGNIYSWMKSLDSNITIKECYGLSEDSLAYYLEIAAAIIIGGGEDVNPNLYKRPDYIGVCGKINNYRDSLELKMIYYASDNKLPIIGICRGQQIINVAHGGTLIPDIPTYVDGFNTHRINKDSAHIILPVDDTWLTENFQEDSFWVNSTHHQSIDELAEGFEVVAYAPDSVIEAISIRDKSIHPFTMGVQFHPERLRDSLSNKFGMMFLNAFN